MVYVPRGVLTAWGVMGLILLGRWRRQHWRSPLGWMLLGLVGSAALAAALAAAQLLPVLEFTQATSRAAGEGPHDIYPFSIEPQRLVELIWPSVFGTSFGRNAYWLDAAHIPGMRPAIWVPSLYIGCLALILAAAALRFRRGPARQVWLSVIVTVSLVGSLGQYTSPIWAARLLAADHRHRAARHRPAGHRQRHADPARWLSPGRGWKSLLVDDHGSARLPPVSLPGQALHVHHLRTGRAGRDGLGLPAGRAEPRHDWPLPPSSWC